MAATGTDPERAERFAALADAYLKMVNAVQNDELGLGAISVRQVGAARRNHNRSYHLETRHRFSERETEDYYDAEDVIYRSVWDADGSVHWGVFDTQSGNETGSIREEFLAAGIRLNELMVAAAGIDENSRVLDVGCGNGTTATWLCRASGAQVTGIDLSGGCASPTRWSRWKRFPSWAGRLAFEKASATGAAVCCGNLHARLEPGHDLPRAGQGKGSGGIVPGIAARRGDDF